MNREEKALLYEDYVREGDRVNRMISRIKSNVNMTPKEEQELVGLNQKLVNLERKVEDLFRD